MKMKEIHTWIYTQYIYKAEFDINVSLIDVLLQQNSKHGCSLTAAVW
jgi:hypothetical protein